MTTYEIKDVRVQVNGIDIGMADKMSLHMEDTPTLVLTVGGMGTSKGSNPQMSTYAQALKAEPVATYIGDQGYGKKKAQWKQEQRRFRK